MKVGKPFFIALIIWLVLLVGDTVVEMNNMQNTSVSGALDMFGSALTKGGELKTFLMGIKVDVAGSFGVTVQFFIILAVFAIIGLVLSGRKPAVNV